MKNIRDAVSDFNNISDELLNKIPKLRRNKTVKYRVYGSYNPKTKKYNLLTAIHIPSTDVIYDPGKDDWVNIAMVERVLADGKPQFIDLWITDSTNNVIILNGNNNRHQKIYRYFELCNYNASNPNRDKSAPKIIERIDDVANYLAEHEKSERRREALAIVTKWSDEEVIRYWESKDPAIRVSLKARDGKGIDQQYFKYLKARLMDIAESNPENFIAESFGANGNAEDIASVISRAKELGMFKLSTKTGKFFWPDGRELFVYKKDFGVKPYEKLKEYFLRDAQGRKDFSIIREELSM